ncbi:undecaprenyl-diphosphate phosphatase [bacterium]|nr:undecaprenyl-diphosphate phosphatase [bacterium]
MELLHIIILALIQGLTEFLPISSSGHLLLPKELLGWPDQQLAFDLAVHLGTLAAVMLYFWKDVFSIARDWTGSLITQRSTEYSRLGWFLIIGTIPAALFGLVFEDLIEHHLRAIWVVATTTIIFGVLLGLADRKRGATKDLTSLTLQVVLIIGCAQALALIPGTSRSGITITAALFCGLSRTSAARFSFLLAIPIILLSGGYKTLQLLKLDYVNWGDLGLGVLLSFISALVCIHFFLRFINTIGMMPFVIYRLLLGGLLFAVYFNPQILSSLL